MSLTPEDIEKKRFHDAWRGYNHEEVDLFLDEVAATFVALRRQAGAGGGGGGAGGGGPDNSERVRELEAQLDALRRQVAQSGQAQHSAQAVTDNSERVRELEAQVDALRRSLAESERNLEQTQRSLDAATLEVQAAQAAAAARGPASDAREARAEELRGTESLLRRTLIAAQKAADEAVAEAEQQAAESVAEARRVAAQIEADASMKGNALLEAAQQQIDELELRSHQLRALYAEHHERARVFVEEQRQTLERMPAPEEVGTLPARHAIPGEGDPAASAEESHADGTEPGEPGGTQEYEVVPLVQTDEERADEERRDDAGFDQTRVQEASEPAWPLHAPEAGAAGEGDDVDSPWGRSKGSSAGGDSGSGSRSAADPEDAEKSVRELFWGKG